MMENNEMIVSFSGSFLAYLEAHGKAQEKQIIAEIKALLEDEPLDLDECGTLVIDAVCRLCEAGGIKPSETVQKLERLLYSPTFAGHNVFMAQYAKCLSCLCGCQDIKGAEDTLKKLESILEEPFYRDSPLIAHSYLSSLRAFAVKHEPLRGKQVIALMEDYARGTCAFEDYDNIFQYGLALEHLCCKQSKMGDVDSAYETLQKLAHVFASLKDNHSGIARCYAVSLVTLCGNKHVPEKDAYGMVDTLEHLTAQTQLAENEEIALQYMLGIFYLCCKQSGKDAAHSAQRAGKIAEDPRYVESHDIIIWYSTILSVLIKKQAPIERKKTYEKIQAIGTKPHILKDKRYISNFNAAKRFLLEM